MFKAKVFTAISAFEVFRRIWFSQTIFSENYSLVKGLSIQKMGKFSKNKFKL